MQYSEDATQAANYLREAIPLMVKYGIHPNPRNFALWYTYVSKRNPELNQEMDQVISEHHTCPVEISNDLFRRFVIDEEVDFAEHVQDNLSSIISNLSEKTEQTLEEEQNFENQLKQSLHSLQSDDDTQKIESVITQLIEHTKDASKAAKQFRGEMDKANSEIDQLRKELKELAEQASIDPLTELNNRRAFDKEIKRLAAESGSAGGSFCLLLSDIDHFKKCNDTYGHVIGDKVLQSFAKVLKHICGDIGFAARYGGEEFVVLLPEHSLDRAAEIAEKIRTTTADMKIKQRGSNAEIDSVTISLGVAQYLPNEDIQEYISRADNALYQAKENGRNQVVVES